MINVLTLHNPKVFFHPYPEVKGQPHEHKEVQLAVIVLHLQQYVMDSFLFPREKAQKMYCLALRCTTFYSTVLYYYTALYQNCKSISFRNEVIGGQI